MPFAYRFPFRFGASAQQNVRKAVHPAAVGIPNRLLGIGNPSGPNPFGVDIKNYDDIDPFFSLVGGIYVLAQDLYHLITSKPGSIPGAPSMGYDTKALLNQGITSQDLASIQSSMQSHLQSDERVQAAQVLCSFLDGTLTPRVNVMPINPGYGAQPFQFVAALSAVGSQLISVSPTVSS